MVIEEKKKRDCCYMVDKEMSCMCKYIIMVFYLFTGWAESTFEKDVGLNYVEAHWCILSIVQSVLPNLKLSDPLRQLLILTLFTLLLLGFNVLL